jgi:predicted component of type VI protein secretion system
MNVRLVVASPNSTTKQIRLGPKTLVGRSAECNLRIASGLVSRRHCLIKVEDDVVFVRDLGSSNGTKVNGEAVEPNTEVVACAGSAISIGPLKFIVQFAAPKERSDEDTEWLPRLPPEQTGSSPNIAAQIDAEFATEGRPSEQTYQQVVQALVTPRPPTGEETKDIPLEQRRQSTEVPNDVVGDADPASVAASEFNPAESGIKTISDLSELPSESVLDPVAESAPNKAETPADALKRKASETYLEFAEDDLRAMNLMGATEPGQSLDESDSPPDDDEMDDELRKFLRDS